MIFRRLREEDATALEIFYNSLSKNSKRTFRPLGEKTTLKTCTEICQANQQERNQKYDLVVFLNEQIISWAFIWDLHQTEPFFGIGIADEHQGQGLGKKLMKLILNEANNQNLEKLYLTVVKDNQIAWKMYQKFGFVQYDEYLEKDGLIYFRMVADLKSCYQAGALYQGGSCYTLK